MTDEIHAERRDPEQPEGAFDLVAAGRDLLETAGSLNSGRASRTLTPGAGAALKQTLVGILAEQSLGTHRAPSPATIQVLDGHVTITAGEETMELEGGHWGVIPDTEHDLHAHRDTVFLLTVVIAEEGNDEG